MPRINRACIVIGTPKSGTTALYDALAATDAFSLPHLKETRYFLEHDHPLRRSRVLPGGMPSVESYLSLFHGKSQLALEATPDYVYSPAARQGLTQLLDSGCELSLVCAVRDPISRLRSMFLFARDTIGRLPADASLDAYATDLLNGHTSRWTAATPLLAQALEQGRYAQYLAPWAEAFGDRVRVVAAEDMKLGPQEFLADLAEWLRINVQVPLPAMASSNVTVRPRSYRLHRLVRRAARRAPEGGKWRHGARRVYDMLNSAEASGAAANDAFSPGTYARLRDYYRNDAAQVASLLQLSNKSASPDWASPDIGSG